VLKALLIVLGVLSAVLVVAQLVMGQMILRSGHNPQWTTPHRHSGYLTVVVTLVYIVSSLIAIAALPRREGS
jgi:hypothetical protein